MPHQTAFTYPHMLVLAAGELQAGRQGQAGPATVLWLGMQHVRANARGVRVAELAA